MVILSQLSLILLLKSAHLLVSLLLIIIQKCRQYMSFCSFLMQFTCESLQATCIKQFICQFHWYYSYDICSHWYYREKYVFNWYYSNVYCRLCHCLQCSISEQIKSLSCWKAQLWRHCVLPNSFRDLMVCLSSSVWLSFLSLILLLLTVQIHIQPFLIVNWQQLKYLASQPNCLCVVSKFQLA